jgi:hypothetical protein
MRLQQRQRGLGLWGWIFVLGVIGFAAMITLKLVPIYLSEMAIEKVVKATANDPANGGVPIGELRRNMRTRWDVEGISTLDVTDVQIVKTPQGRALGYEYDAKADLFYNISIVVHFQNQFVLKGGGGTD